MALFNELCKKKSLGKAKIRIKHLSEEHCK